MDDTTGWLTTNRELLQAITFIITIATAFYKPGEAIYNRIKRWRQGRRKPTVQAPSSQLPLIVTSAMTVYLGFIVLGLAWWSWSPLLVGILLLVLVIAMAFVLRQVVVHRASLPQRPEQPKVVERSAQSPLGRYWRKHTGEILWAAVFALVAAYFVELIKHFAEVADMDRIVALVTLPIPMWAVVLLLLAITLLLRGISNLLSSRPADSAETISTNEEPKASDEAQVEYPDVAPEEEPLQLNPLPTQSQRPVAWASADFDNLTRIQHKQRLAVRNREDFCVTADDKSSKYTEYSMGARQFEALRTDFTSVTDEFSFCVKLMTDHGEVNGRHGLFSPIDEVSFTFLKANAYFILTIRDHNSTFNERIEIPEPTRFNLAFTAMRGHGAEYIAINAGGHVVPPFRMPKGHRKKLALIQLNLLKPPHEISFNNIAIYHTQF